MSLLRWHRLSTSVLLMSSLLSSTITSSAEGAMPKATRDRARMIAQSQTEWDRLLQGTCKTDANAKLSAQCAYAAYSLAGTICSNSSLIYQRGNTWWELADFGLIVSSAVFTGIGASATLSQAKVFSTLGGTTGLGAVTTTAKLNTSSDQLGIAAINSVESDLRRFVTTPDSTGNLPSAEQIFFYSDGAAHLCMTTPAMAPAAPNQPAPAPAKGEAPKGSEPKPSTSAPAPQ